MEHRDLEGNARNFRFFLPAFSLFFLDPDENRLAAWNLQDVPQQPSDILSKKSVFYCQFNKGVKIPILYSIE